MDKEWLFKENMRLNMLSQELEQQKKILKLEKEKLNGERKVFDQQKQVLETGFRKLAADKEMFRAEMKKQQSEARKESAKKDKDKDKGQALLRNGFCGPGFFGGVTGASSLKKRYKELMKIYHPDNKCGDSFTVACINREYEILKERFKNQT